MRKILDRNELFEGVAVPDWATAAARFEGNWYFEERLEQLDGDRFMWVDTGNIHRYGEGTIRGYGEAVLFTPLVEQDDPLPPAPRCVRYNEGTAGFTFEVKSLVENAYHPNRIRLGVLCGDRDITHKYVVVDPDAALQLAHDLNRMANEIKRRERAQSGE